MGLLDQVLGGVGMGSQQNSRGPGIGGTVAAGVVLALLVKGVRAYQASHGPAGEGRSFDPQGQPAGGPPQGGLGGILGGLGGMLGGGAGGGGLGGLLGGLGGAGALGALVSQFQQKGYGSQVDSWVGHGDNQQIAPAEVEDALGGETVQALQQQTGMPRETLLQELSHLLPQALNEVTPQGRPPSDEELHQIAGQAAPRPV